MNNFYDETDQFNHQDEDCLSIESCDCQGICTCEETQIDFDLEQDGCDNCCCEEDSSDCGYDFDDVCENDNL